MRPARLKRFYFKADKCYNIPIDEVSACKMSRKQYETRGKFMLTGKTIVLAVSGSIAAYKIPNLARMLKKKGPMFRFL